MDNKDPKRHHHKQAVKVRGGGGAILQRSISTGKSATAKPLLTNPCTIAGLLQGHQQTRAAEGRPGEERQKKESRLHASNWLRSGAAHNAVQKRTS